MIDISGLDKADLLAALYNNSRPQGMGIMHYDPKPMTVEEARTFLNVGDDLSQMFGDLPGRSMYFDYLKGRVMKVNLSGDELDAWGYDRDLGEGAAMRVISSLRNQ